MALDRAERVSLAGFFAKRFPDDDQREDVAARAGVPVSAAPATTAAAAWERLLAEAETRGRLARLARAAARLDPEDANLQRAAALLARQEPRVRPALVGALAVGVPLAAAGLVGVVAWFAGSFDPDVAMAAPVVAPVAAEVTPVAVAPAEEPVGPAQPVGVALAAGVATEPAVAGPDLAAAVGAVPVQPAGGLADVPPANEAGRCTLEAGGLIGYWWAGDEAPGQAGDVLEMAQDHNVRASLPSFQNHYDVRAPVRCVLLEGDRVRLTAAPEAVSGGAYWVPLHSGDLLSQR